MATENIKKFLDSAGVSVLWGAVAAELNKKAAADNVYTKQEVDNKIAAIPQYDDTGVKADIKTNTDAIALLNSDAGVAGSVAYKIAQIVNDDNNDDAVNTLQEIAAWIAAHPADAAEYNQRIATNAADIEALEKLVGSTAVATQISEAVNTAFTNANLNQYALASALTETANALSTLKGTGKRLITEDEITKLSKLVLGTNGEVSMSGSVAAGNVVGLTGVIDDQIDARIDALSSAEIKAACGITE